MLNNPRCKRSRPLACMKLMRQYFTFLLSFSSIRFIAQSHFPPTITTNEFWCHQLLGLIPPATTGEAGPTTGSQDYPLGWHPACILFRTPGKPTMHKQGSPVQTYL